VVVGRLSQAERGRVRDALGRLESAFAGPGYDVEVAGALDALGTEGVGTTYDWSEEIGPCYAVADPGLCSELNRRGLGAAVARHRRYDPTRPDPLAHRPLSADHLFDDKRALEIMLAELLGPVGFWDQVRSVRYHHGRFLVWVGLLAPRRRALGELEEDLLAPLLERIHDGFVLTRLVAGTTNGTELCRILDAVPSPILVAYPSGRAAFANRAARATLPRATEWLRAAVADPDRAPPSVSIARVQIDGDDCIVVSRSGAQLLPAPPTVPAAWRLPRRLGEVATLLLQGLSDKEVADRLSMRLATERTYVARLYRRLGVHGRFELMRLAAREA